MGSLLKKSIGKVSDMKAGSKKFTGIDPKALPRQGDYGQAGTGGGFNDQPRPKKGRGGIGPAKTPMST